MIKIQRLLLLFCINVCFSQHIHENIQWNNTTEPENENGYDFNILYQLGLEEQRRVEGDVKRTDPNPTN